MTQFWEKTAQNMSENWRNNNFGLSHPLFPLNHFGEEEEPFFKYFKFHLKARFMGVKWKHFNWIKM